MPFDVIYLDGALVSPRDPRSREKVKPANRLVDSFESWADALAHVVALQQRPGYDVWGVFQDDREILSADGLRRMIEDWKFGRAPRAPYFAADAGVTLPPVRHFTEALEFGRKAGARELYAVDGCALPEAAKGATWRPVEFDEVEAMQQPEKRAALGLARLQGWTERR
ncbi:hypothetical protein EDC65_3592 [Stella humosa]|uniref:Uncharacterized protein n=1 Tax=Stella humosa TaxID=94 RepID=A0A3N1KWC8_9PROT|nr:hypothetical protein [Stella humosa]ROP84244.1 hypothetical protein EDC65_3592 [Stella humosa]BBK33756.1 hypothetical protein STHU_43900 [Stella humosa]